MMWENYEKIFDEEFITVSIPFAIFNTVWRTVGSVAVNMFFTACTSYVVCKYSHEFKWLNWVYAFVVTIMIVMRYLSIYYSLSQMASMPSGYYYFGGYDMNAKELTVLMVELLKLVYGNIYINSNSIETVFDCFRVMPMLL